MTKKRKQKPTSRINLVIIGAIMVLGGFGVSTQAAGNLAIRHILYPHEKAVTLAAPATPTPTPVPATPTPHATAAPAPAPKPKKAVTRRVAVAPKPLPPVTPAPDSVVSHLVPVAAVPTPTPAPTDTPAPGLGSGTPAPSPTPAPPASVYSSTNWSGYMSPKGNFTAVSGAWAVPNVSGNGFSTSGDATWIGIGGVTSSDLIQVGTDDTVSRTGQVSTIAFYEMLPDSETLIPSMLVSPGDAMTADIHLISGTNWLITINNVTQHETFSTTVSYASSQSTAEWIEEDPSYSSGGLVPFDHFGSVTFTNSLATSGGVSQNLIDSGAQEIILVNSHGHALATPSAIGSDGGSFTVN